MHQPDPTREKLLSAAKKLFSQKGFDGTTVKALCDEAGVNVSLISYHFNGKEGLYRSCLEQFGHLRLESARRILGHPASNIEDLVARLRLFLEDIVLTHIEEGELTQIIHRECDLEAPIAKDIFENTFLEAFKTLIEFLRSAQKHKLLRPKLNPQIMGGSLFGSIMHYSKADRINKRFFGASLENEEYRNEVVNHLIQIFLDGTRKEAAL